MPLTRWIEGRISAAKRKRGLRHCLNHGRSGFVYWIGWGMIAADLTMIDHALERT
jgi:IS5 family transposase